MNDKQRNRLSMQLAVLGVMETYASEWQAFPAIQEIVTRLDGLVQNVQNNSGLQGTPRTGITQGKNRKLVEMIRRTAELAGDLHAHAVKQQNDALAGQVDVEVSDLAKLAEPLVGPRCRELYTLVNQHAAELEEYGTTAADVAALDAAIAAYETVVTAPRQATAVNTSVTAAIAADLRAGSELLKAELDRALRKFERKSPAFYQAYRDARVIVDLHGHPEEPAAPAGGGGSPATPK